MTYSHEIKQLTKCRLVVSLPQNIDNFILSKYYILRTNPVS